jgi:(S)-mandelate dehydrogenase
VPWRRRPSGGGDVKHALNIADLREIARRRIPGFVFEYLEGGAEDEVTLRANRAALEALRFIPQTLVDTECRHHRTSIFGRECAAPFFIAPTGGNGMLHPQGDLCLARAAARLGVPFCLSTVSTMRLEDIASSAGGRLWMQLYVMQDRAIAEDIMRRADAAGYEALVFTTDANVFGSREWDRRNYRAPGKPKLRAILDLARHPRWVYEVLLRDGMPRFRNLESFLPPGAAKAVGGSTILPNLFKATITWNDIAWIRRFWPRKLLIKGILSVSDARRAADLGCDGIFLTNHGGRQLDSCVSPMDVLPEIKAAVGGRLAVFADSGFRRGTDIVKALASGANAVGIGRATLYGLTADGERGVERALEILTTETHRVLGQLGCCSVADLGPHLLRGSSRSGQHATDRVDQC